MTKLPLEKLQRIVDHHLALEAELVACAGGGEDYVRISREYAELIPVVEGARALWKLEAEISDLEEMLQDSDIDSEMVQD